MMGASRSGLKARSWGASSAALLGLCLGLAAAIGPAAADKVGVAAAVNPDAFSSLSGSPQSQLNIGKSIFFNERINTTASGLVQVLLVDGSTFTVGPGSDLVIDKFVYDPKKQTGQIVASFSKGVARFVGGKISKNENGVTVNTPAGALAIRGGMAQGNGKIWSFLYGTAMTFTSKGGKTYSVYEPGYTLDLTSGSPTIRPTRPEDIKAVMAALTNGSTNGLGNTSTDGTGPATTLQNDTIADPDDTVNEATQTQIQDTLQKQQNQQTTDTTTPPPPDPIPVNVRILASPGVYTAFPDTPNKYTTDNGSGLLGGGKYPDNAPAGPHGDDFLWTFGVLNGRMFGTVTGLIDANCTNPNCQTIEAHVVSDASVDFPWFEANQTDAPGGACIDGFCVVTDAKVVQGGVTTNLVGIAVAKPGFFAYQIRPGQWNTTGDTGPILVPAENDNDPMMIIGGDGYTFDTPSGKVHTFQLTQDISQPGAFGPFASETSSPTTAGRYNISSLMLLEKDAPPPVGSNEVDTSRAVWLQTNFFVGTDPSKRETFINIALGEWDPTTGLTGERRGGSMVAYDLTGAANPQTYSFTGDIASLAGPDSTGALSHFMGAPGSNPNLVIGFDSTGTHNIGRDAPLNPVNPSVENQSGATYHIGVGGAPIAEPLAQTTATFKGYAAGLAQQRGSSNVATLVNLSPNDVSISLDAETNTMTASLNLGDGLLQNPKYNLKFGGEERSAFIDDKIFAAIEAESGSSVSEKYLETRRGPFGIPIIQLKTYVDNDPDVQSYMVSADAINANAVLFPIEPSDSENPEAPAPVQKRAFCQSCDFMKWGAWGTRVTSNDHSNQATTKDVQLGWWIGGKVVSSSDMPIQGGATYKGDAIGTVATNGQQYTATGDMDMSWDFRKRSGLLSISDFDGKDFSGLMLAPGKAQFAGVLTGSDHLIGAANGSFVGSTGYRAIPQGVIGNFGVGNSSWKATGIFGGTNVTP